MSNDPKIAQSVGETPSWMRASRSQEDQSRTNEDGTALTMEERIKNLRDIHTGDILPDANKLKHKDPEMHYFWASTTSKSDPIYRRQQLGYEFVRSEELPELAIDFRVSEGLYEGCVACNELILMKIPRILANELMKINHHERPLEEEQRIKAEAVRKDDSDSDGRQLGGFTADDAGFKHIIHDRCPPKSFL